MIFLYTDRPWHRGIIHTYQETNRGIWVSRVSVCWVFLFVSIHTYRETSHGIWVSRVSACCVSSYISIYTHTERQAVVSGYPGYQPAGSFFTRIKRNKSYPEYQPAVSLCIYQYTHSGRQAVVSGYPGYQPAGSFCMYVYTHTERQAVVSGYPGYQPGGSFCLYPIHVCRETSCGIWVSKVSECRFSLYWVENKHTQASGSIRLSRISKYLVFLHVKTYVHRGWPWYWGIRILRLSLCKDINTDRLSSQYQSFEYAFA